MPSHTGSSRVAGYCLIVMLGCSVHMPLRADTNSREAVEALEAYAVYKMALYDEAFERFLALAEKGNQQGMLNLAGMLAAGLGTERDLAAAFKWYRQSAQAGSAIGMFYMAEAYQRGHGVDQNKALAREWYLKASELGSHDAQIAWSRLLLDSGQEDKARNRLSKWAADGNSGAAELLAMIDGSTLSTDIAAADRILISRAWESIDRSATAGNADGVVFYLDHHASIHIRLPGLSSWAQTDKAGLRELWRRNFQASGNYQFSRSEIQLEKLNSDPRRYRVSSIISEVLPAGLAGNSDTTARTLTITETAIVTLIDDVLAIEEIKLDIAAVD